jgi:hypothetical protein
MFGLSQHASNPSAMAIAAPLIKKPSLDGEAPRAVEVDPVDEEIASIFTQPHAEDSEKMRKAGMTAGGDDSKSCCGGGGGGGDGGGSGGGGGGKDSFQHQQLPVGAVPPAFVRPKPQSPLVGRKEAGSLDSYPAAMTGLSPVRHPRQTSGPTTPDMVSSDVYPVVNAWDEYAFPAGTFNNAASAALTHSQNLFAQVDIGKVRAYTFMTHSCGGVARQLLLSDAP